MYIFLLDWDPVQYLGYCMGAIAIISAQIKSNAEKIDMSYVQADHPRASNFSHFSPLFNFHFSSCLHFTPQIWISETLSPLFHQGFSLCLPLPDALLCSFLNPDCASSTTITSPRRFDKSGLGLIGLLQNPLISFRLYHPHFTLSSSKSSTGCQFQRLVVCLCWSSIVRFWFGSVLGAHYFGCSSHF